MDYTSLSVQEIRNFIIESGYPEAAAIKGKANLVQFILEHNLNYSEPSIFDDAEMEESEIEVQDLEEKSEPVYNSPEWNDYVLANLGPDEVDTNGHPLLIGLRRITEELLGEIQFSGPVFTSYNISEGNPYASCIYEIQILWKKDLSIFITEKGTTNLNIKTFRASGDSFIDNTDQPWNMFASAIAESRAEARALRKALNLKVVTGEELTNKIKIGNKNEDKITQNQLNLIRVKIDKLGLKENFSEFTKVNKSLKNCTSEDGRELIKIINQYQGDIKNIPEEVKVEKK